ncbi:hypothetical protein EF916_13820 [Streptomyces sp. WAC08452]|nr:hypothetical protein EF916_13820 [Streptomyces sp. WAC08452]
MGVGRGWVCAARRYGVPLRPPVPPQRHDCPQLRWHGGVAAYGGEGACRGVSARSGWRVRAVHPRSRPIPRRSEDGHPPARPRPITNRSRYAHPHRTRSGAAGTPTTNPHRPPQAPPTKPHRPPQAPPPNRRRFTRRRRSAAPRAGCGRRTRCGPRSGVRCRRRRPPRRR